MNFSKKHSLQRRQGFFRVGGRGQAGRCLQTLADAGKPFVAARGWIAVLLLHRVCFRRLSRLEFQIGRDQVVHWGMPAPFILQCTQDRQIYVGSDVVPGPAGVGADSGEEPRPVDWLFAWAFPSSARCAAWALRRTPAASSRHS